MCLCVHANEWCLPCAPNPRFQSQRDASSRQWRRCNHRGPPHTPSPMPPFLAFPACQTCRTPAWRPERGRGDPRPPPPPPAPPRSRRRPRDEVRAPAAQTRAAARPGAFLTAHSRSARRGRLDTRKKVRNSCVCQWLALVMTHACIVQQHNRQPYTPIPLRISPSMTMMFPGWQSAWNKPSRSIMCP